MSPISLHFHNKSFTFVLYLKPSTSSKKSLKKYLMLDLLASNSAKEFFESIIPIYNFLYIFLKLTKISAFS